MNFIVIFDLRKLIREEDETKKRIVEKKIEKICRQYKTILTLPNSKEKRKEEIRNFFKQFKEDEDLKKHFSHLDEITLKKYIEDTNYIIFLEKSK